jgi:hypothetical protein
VTQKRIATGGKAGAGKDFILKILTQYEAMAGRRARPVVIGGFGDLVRADWLEVHGRPAAREEQQDWGQLRRTQSEDYWLRAAVRWADSFGGDAVVGFSGVRFPNELSYLQDHDFRVGLVEAPKHVRVQRLFNRDGYVWSEEKLNHITETSLDLIPRDLWDFIVVNG